MSMIEEVFATGLTTRSRSGMSFPFDWSSTPLTYLPAANPWLRSREGSMVRPNRVLSIQVNEAAAPMVGLAVVVERQLNELLAMRAGWNEGRGAALSDVAVKVAVPMVFEILRDQALAPQLFPLPDGGLQFEWHIEGSSIEVEVEPDGSAFAVAETRDREIEIEEDVDDSTLAKLHAFLGRIVTAA